MKGEHITNTPTDVIPRLSTKPQIWVDFGNRSRYTESTNGHLVPPPFGEYKYGKIHRTNPMNFSFTFP